MTLLAACGRGPDDHTDLTVYAAASLRLPFTEIAEVFEQRHRSTTVRFNFAGSSDLVAQLQQGGPADVLATADEITMRRAGGRTGPPEVFATNTMTIVVPADNPGRVTNLRDLGDPDLYVVTCAPQVPCGAATTRIEASSGVRISTDSEEASVTDVLNKVATGQADAGIVYTSDVVGSDATVRSIAIPPAVNARNVYQIAVVADSDDARAAQDFLDLVTSAQGGRILADAGFSDSDR